MSVENDGDDPSYIDYETLLDPDFSPSNFANSLILSTNNASDTPLDLSTPLSRVLFDTQELDSHIDLLTTKSAIPLLTHTKEQTDASSRIVTEIDNQVKAVNDSYKQLEKEVIQKHAEADEVRQVASRLWETLKLGRAVGRCLQLGRQLEVQHTELTGSANPIAASSSRKEDHRALIRCTQTLLSLRELLASAKTQGSEGYGLDRVTAIRTLQVHVIEPIERSVRDMSERTIREFSVGSASSTATFSQTEETKAKTVSALTTLYLLSPTSLAKGEKWTPSLMLQTLEIYLRTSLQSSIAGLSRALAALPSLERTLAEVSARCQNIVALEAVLDSTKIPAHPLLPANVMKQAALSEKGTMLQALLAHLETGSLASYFWRTMASSLSTRVQEIVTRGGVSARTLKTRRNEVGDAIKECVVKGSQLPSTMSSGPKGKAKSGEATKGSGFEREVAVMVGSVVGHLGR